jgi:hypothetical protein
MLGSPLFHDIKLCLADNSDESNSYSSKKSGTEEGNASSLGGASQGKQTKTKTKAICAHKVVFATRLKQRIVDSMDELRFAPDVRQETLQQLLWYLENPNLISIC